MVQVTYSTIWCKLNPKTALNSISNQTCNTLVEADNIIIDFINPQISYQIPKWSSLPKSFSFFLVMFQVMLKHGGVTLSQTVDVKNGTQIVQFVLRCKVHSFPNWSFSWFCITNHTVHTIAAGWGKKQNKKVKKTINLFSFSNTDQWWFRPREQYWFLWNFIFSMTA